MSNKCDPTGESVVSCPLVVRLRPLVGQSAKDCKSLNQWTTNRYNPNPPVYLLRLHATKGELLLLSALLLAGAPPEDAFEGNL